MTHTHISLEILEISVFVKKFKLIIVKRYVFDHKKSQISITAIIHSVKQFYVLNTQIQTAWMI